MKPGNLRKRGAKSGGETKDEDSVWKRTSNLRCAVFIAKSKGKIENGKKTLYL